MAQCSAYRENDLVCSNGFFQVVACREEVKCFACGSPGRIVPHCLKDELPEHWITDDGKPRFAPASSTHSEGVAKP
jgi:hypothetical protein